LSDDNSIENFTYSTEFSDVLDVLGINPEMMTNVSLGVKEYNVKLSENSEGGDTAVISAVVTAYIDAYESAEETGIYDAYSPEYYIKTSYDDIGYLTLLTDETKQSSVSGFIETNGNIEDVLDAKADIVIRSQSYSENGEITIEALVTASVIDAENGRINSVKKEIPVTFNFDTEKDLFDIQIVPYINIAGISYMQKGANQIELKIPVICEVILFSKNHEKLITDIDIDNAEKIDKSNMPSLTVYVVQSGDTLWNIAKKYNTRVEDIAKINNIENENDIAVNRKLLIPKKR
ncbi:MAG: LysM domain-containing protein, partial [Clostridia bacterium]|nr:LysM domain-containing protein [Clostridia bacterium]